MDGTFQTTADLYQRGPYRPFLEEARTIGAAPVPMVVMTQGAGAHPEPALPQYGLNLVLAGACGGRFDFGAGAFAMPHRPGEIALAPPSVACDYRAEGPHRVLCLCLPAGRVELLLDEAGGRPSDLDDLHRRAFRDLLVTQLASRLWDEAVHGGPRGALYAEGSVLAIVASLLRSAAPRRAATARARATRLPRGACGARSTSCLPTWPRRCRSPTSPPRPACRRTTSRRRSRRPPGCRRTLG